MGSHPPPVDVGLQTDSNAASCIEITCGIAVKTLHKEFGYICTFEVAERYNVNIQDCLLRLIPPTKRIGESRFGTVAGYRYRDSKGIPVNHAVILNLFSEGKNQGIMLSLEKLCRDYIQHFATDRVVDFLTEDRFEKMIFYKVFAYHGLICLNVKERIIAHPGEAMRLPENQLTFMELLRYHYETAQLHPFTRTPQYFPPRFGPPHNAAMSRSFNDAHFCSPDGYHYRPGVNRHRAPRPHYSAPGAHSPFPPPNVMNMQYEGEMSVGNINFSGVAVSASYASCCPADGAFITKNAISPLAEGQKPNSGEAPTAAPSNVAVSSADEQLSVSSQSLPVASAAGSNDAGGDQNQQQTTVYEVTAYDPSLSHQMSALSIHSGMPSEYSGIDTPAYATYQGTVVQASNGGYCTDGQWISGCISVPPPTQFTPQGQMLIQSPSGQFSTQPVAVGMWSVAESQGCQPTNGQGQMSQQSVTTSTLNPSATPFQNPNPRTPGNITPLSTPVNSLSAVSLGPVSGEPAGPYQCVDMSGQQCAALYVQPQLYAQPHMVQQDMSPYNLRSVPIIQVQMPFNQMMTPAGAVVRAPFFFSALPVTPQVGQYSIPPPPLPQGMPPDAMALCGTPQRYRLIPLQGNATPTVAPSHFVTDMHGAGQPLSAGHMMPWAMAPVNGNGVMFHRNSNMPPQPRHGRGSGAVRPHRGTSN